MKKVSKATAILSIVPVLLWLEWAGAQMPMNGSMPDVMSARNPVKVGYAVITPTSPAPAGLVAFETFGETHGGQTSQAGVLPSAMTTHALLFVSTSGRLSRNLGVAIANPNATAASVTLTLRDESGTQIGTDVVHVAAGQQTSQFITELFSSQQSVPHDLTGTLTVSSPIPIAIIGLRFRGINFSTLPATSLVAPSAVPIISPGIGGPAAVILAQFATGGGWASEIVLANTGPADFTVRVDLFGQDGLPLTATLNGQSQSSFAGILIPKGGVVTLAPRNRDGDSDF